MLFSLQTFWFVYFFVTVLTSFHIEARTVEKRVFDPFFLMLKTVLNEGQIDQRKIRKFKSLLGAL